MFIIIMELLSNLLLLQFENKLIQALALLDHLYLQCQGDMLLNRLILLPSFRRFRLPLQ